MINLAIEEDLKRMSLNDVNYSDYIKENYIKIPDNATNGDMMKAMFPNFQINEEWKATRRFELRTDCTEITGIATSDWWNSPYKADKECD